MTKSKYEKEVNWLYNDRRKHALSAFKTWRKKFGGARAYKLVLINYDRIG